MPAEHLAPPAPLPPARVENIAAGTIWMLASGLLFVAMTGVIRHIGATLPPAEAAFIRYIFALVFVSPALLSLVRRPPARRIWALYGVRGLVHGLGVILWFYAMARIPIAEVTALGYAAPLFITILAAIFLGERIRLRRILALLVGLLGVMIILRPGVQEIGPGQIAQLVTTPLFAASFIIAKLLTNEQGSGEIVAMLALGCTITLLPFALADWTDPTLEQVLWLGLVALFATAGHYAQTQAYRFAPITVTQPVQFLQIVWATLLGVLIFAEPIDAFVVIGAGVIVASAWYIARREMQLRRAEQADERARAAA